MTELKKIVIKKADVTKTRDELYEEKTTQRAQEIAQELADDIAYHFQKHGPQRLSVPSWTMVITEEWGETVQAYMQGRKHDAIKEAKQAAACLIRFAIECEREEDGSATAEWDLYVQPV